MRELNSVTASIGGFNGRITRARAANSGARAGAPAYNEPNQVKKRVPQPRPKRAAVDQKNITASDNQSKRRAVLQEVTNVSCHHAYLKCQDATKVQVKNKKQARIITTTKVASSDNIVIEHTQANQKPAEIDKEMLDNLALDKVKGLSHIEENTSSNACGTNDHQSKIESAENPSHPQIPIIKGNKNCIYEASALPTALGIVNIDYDYKDPQLCSIYAPDIYHSLRVFERVRRPHSNFMEMAQSDITQSMRAILIDWIVEVAEEYKLVPDTLYLTVYLIDWFLSQNYIERQRLQLLGITCMLIASKYEEICAPRVDEFCFITDNTYSRDEVLTMERQIIKYCGFHVSVPTSKTFLRRFLRAAQASYKSPSLELEYLANYLTELTLIDYSFLKFLPSAVAASAVFLAKWTLDQASHPWDSTLEYYTFYKASDLKCTVLALQDLQLNISGCPLTAIRSKYKQQKFKSVAALSSPKLLDTLF